MSLLISAVVAPVTCGTAIAEQILSDSSTRYVLLNFVLLLFVFSNLLYICRLPLDSKKFQWIIFLEYSRP